MKECLTYKDQCEGIGEKLEQIDIYRVMTSDKLQLTKEKLDLLKDEMREMGHDDEIFENALNQASQKKPGEQRTNSKNVRVARMMQDEGS